MYLKNRYCQLYGSIQSGPPTPAVITSFPIGNPSGQMPTVHVRDISNNFDLYTKGADTPSHYPASCVKMMTLLLLWEYMNGSWTSTVTVTSPDVTQPYAGLTVSFAGLQANDVISWEDLAYCIALPSGGDACQCVARLIGTAIYTAAGSTGTTGNTRFIERMNARAVELGMTNTTYFDSFGGSESTGPTVTRNILSARDLTTVANEAWKIPTIRTITGTTSRNATITGANARTLALSNVIAVLNGPSFSPAGIKDSRVLASKTGTWVVSGVNQYNMTTLWHSPAGYDIVITTIGSESDYARLLDQRGLMYSILKDFPYLDASAGTDANWSNVKVLVGADGSIVDESTVARTVTNSGATVGTPLFGTGSILLDNVNDSVYVADATDLTVGSGDLTVELWWSGDAAVPGGGVERVFFGKNTGGAQREYILNYFNGGFNIFASSDGSSWTNNLAYNLASVDQPVFFNGAPRHLALVKSGSTWSMYINGEKAAGTVSVSSVFNGTGNLSLSLTGVAPLGRIDEFRHTVGTARYTAAMVSLTGHKFPRS